MSNKGMAIVSFCIGFSVVCVIWGCLWMVMAKDLGEKVEILEREKGSLEQEIIDYKWQLDQVPYICGVINGE